MENKAVILGSNYYIGLSVIRCLGYNGIYTVAVDYTKENCYASKSKYLREHLIAPHYSKQEKEFLDFLIAFAKKEEHKPVLFPCADAYVEFIDRHLEELKKYYLINMTEQGLWSRLMDKQALHSIAVEHGVQVPETLATDEAGYLERVRSEIGFPCIVKPTDSPTFMAKFRAKMFMCQNEEDVVSAVEKAHGEGLEVIVQRIIPGFDDHMYTFDTYLNQDSKVTHWMTCQKLRQYPINFGASVYTRQKHIKALYDIGAPFLEAIGYKGFAEIEFKKDAITGSYYLIEINVRTTTLNVLLKQCGINFPLLAYTELTGGEIGSASINHDTGIAFRYLYEDIFAIKDYMRTKQLNLRQIVGTLLLKRAPAIWSFADPAPAFSFLSIIAKKVKRRLIK